MTWWGAMLIAVPSMALLCLALWRLTDGLAVGRGGDQRHSGWHRIN